MAPSNPHAAPYAAPYARIVAEFRRRIGTGELAPGDPLPSTRRLAREHGVALATAAKVLTTLRHEGLVETVPRKGTTVAAQGAGRAHPGAPSRLTAEGAGTGGPGGHDLTRERTVRAAIDIADAEGLDAVSMRALAARLGVSAMTLYRHVDDKVELMTLMADAAFGELDPPAGPRPSTPAVRRQRLELTARTLWTLFRRHPWLAHVNPLHRPLPLPNLLKHGEAMLEAIDGLGLDSVAMLDRQVLLFSFIQGLAAHLEREAQAAAASGISDDDWVDAHSPAFDRISGSGRYPVFARVFGTLRRTGYDLDLDALFTLGIGPLIDAAIEPKRLI